MLTNFSFVDNKLYRKKHRINAEDGLGIALGVALFAFITYLYLTV